MAYQVWEVFKNFIAEHSHFPGALLHLLELIGQPVENVVVLSGLRLHRVLHVDFESLEWALLDVHQVGKNHIA